MDRLGRSAMQAALPMGGQKIVGMADPTVSTDAATKNYVDTTTGAFFSTGDVKLTLKQTNDPGWLIFDDNNFGSAASGAAHAADANQALFLLLFANINDTWSPLLTSTGAVTTRAAQGSAAAAWAANCRMYLPRMLGRALAIAGSGSGLTSHVVGQFLGSETQSLVTANLPPYTPAGTNSTSQSTVANIVTANNVLSSNAAGGANIQLQAPANVGSITVGAQTFTGTPQGGASAAFGIMNPTAYLNAMVKV